jgi:hypothetical protein
MGRVWWAQVERQETWYPSAAIFAAISSLDTWADSYVTETSFDWCDAVTADTPGSAPTARFTAFSQPPQVMPVTESVTSAGIT